MKDPIWKRSGFAPAVLAAVALILRWLIDGAAPTSDAILEVVAVWLSLVLYQRVRPTVGARKASAVVDRVAAEASRLRELNDLLTKHVPPTETVP